jgi:hypothetical protein
MFQDGGSGISAAANGEKALLRAKLRPGSRQIRLDYGRFTADRRPSWSAHRLGEPASAGTFSGKERYVYLRFRRLEVLYL